MKKEKMNNHIHYFNSIEEMKIIVEQRIQELIICIFEQGFLDEWVTQTSLDDSYFLPVGFGLRNILPIQIARGEACKIIMKEGLV